MKGMSFELKVASAQVKSAVILAALRASSRSRFVEPSATRDHTERMLAALENGRARWHALAGAAIGLACLVREVHARRQGDDVGRLSYWSYVKPIVAAIAGGLVVHPAVIERHLRDHHGADWERTVFVSPGRSIGLRLVPTVRARQWCGV